MIGPIFELIFPIFPYAVAHHPPFKTPYYYHLIYFSFS